MVLLLWIPPERLLLLLLPLLVVVVVVVLVLVLVLVLVGFFVSVSIFFQKLFKSTFRSCCFWPSTTSLLVSGTCWPLVTRRPSFWYGTLLSGFQTSQHHLPQDIEQTWLSQDRLVPRAAKKNKTKMLMEQNWDRR